MGTYGNKYLILVHTDESKDTKKYEELWKKIKDLTRSINDNLDYYYEKCLKINFNLGNLRLKKTLELDNIIRCVFHGGNKYYPQIFLGDCL